MDFGVWQCLGSFCLWINLTPVNFGGGFAQILLSELSKQHRFLVSFSSNAFSLEGSESLGGLGDTRH